MRGLDPRRGKGLRKTLRSGTRPRGSVTDILGVERGGLQFGPEARGGRSGRDLRQRRKFPGMRGTLDERHPRGPLTPSVPLMVRRGLRAKGHYPWF